MKLAIIRQAYRPDGGAERIISRLLDGLGKQVSLDVSIIVQQWRVDPSVENITVITVPRSGLFRSDRFSSFVKNVQGILKSCQFDLVQSHERVPGCQIYRAGDGVHAEWLRIRDDQEGFLQRWLLRVNPFHRAVLKAENELFHHPVLKKVVCISQRGKQDILRHYPDVDPAKLVCVYNGIDLRQYAPLTVVDRQNVRASLGLSPETPVAIFVGSGFTRKGVGILLDALALSKDWRLLIVGRDKQQPHFVKRVRNLGLEDRVYFLGVQTRMQEFYGAADILVHPAWYEPFGNVVLEAMAMGCGVLVSSDCGASELVEDGINGHVFPAGNVHQLASLLDNCKDRALLRSMGDNARCTAEQYPVSRMVDGLLAVYRTLLAEK